MKTITIEQLQELASRPKVTLQSKTNLNVFLNEDIVCRLMEDRFRLLSDVLNLRENSVVVDTIFNILNEGSVGDLVIEGGVMGNRRVLFCKLTLDPYGGPWGFTLKAKEVLQREGIYELFKEFIRSFISSSISPHVTKNERNCIYFTYELMPGKAIIYLD